MFSHTFSFRVRRATKGKVLFLVVNTFSVKHNAPTMDLNVDIITSRPQSFTSMWWFLHFGLRLCQSVSRDCKGAMVCTNNINALCVCMWDKGGWVPGISPRANSQSAGNSVNSVVSCVLHTSSFIKLETALIGGGGC